jgi:hypothetical protein
MIMPLATGMEQLMIREAVSGPLVQVTLNVPVPVLAPEM